MLGEIDMIAFVANANSQSRFRYGIYSTIAALGAVSESLGSQMRAESRVPSDILIGMCSMSVMLYKQSLFTVIRWLDIAFVH